LATAGDAWAVQLWRVDDGHRHSRLPSEDTTAAAVTFSPDDRFVAAVTARPATVRLRTAKNGHLYRSLKEVSDWGYALAFNPSGDRVAVGLERTVAVWDPADYRPPTIWPAHAGAVLGVAFTPDGQTLLTGGADGLVKLWDPAGRLRHTFDWKVGDVGAVAFAPDGLTAAAGGVETILVWDVTG
jgi:WD40 repeat protein